MPHSNTPVPMWNPCRELHRGLAALDLADAFIEDTGPRDPEPTRTTILCAAEQVAELAAPGHWERFDAAEFRRRIAYMDDHAITGEMLVLAGFFGWMAFLELMSADDASSILRDIAAAGPATDLLRQFCLGACELLAEQ